MTSQLAACRDKKGTYAGARRHQYAGQQPCEPCRRARNAYRLMRYAQQPATRNMKRVRRRAWARAEADLRKRHRAEFEELYRLRLADEWETQTCPTAAAVQKLGEGS